MKTSAMFQVNLQGLDLSQDQTRELEQMLAKTTSEFLGSFKAGKEYLSDAVFYKPNPDDPYPWPIPWPGPWGPIFGPRVPFPFPPFPGFFPINRKACERNRVDVKQRDG